MNVREFGAVGNGVTNDWQAFQNGLDDAAGGRYAFEVPSGRYLIGGPLSVRSGTRLIGSPGAVLLQAPCPPSTRLLMVYGSDVLIEGLSLEGQRGLQGDLDEHRAGIFAIDTEDLVIRDVVSSGFTGDGIYLYAPTSRTRRALIERVACSGNGRNGLTIGSPLTGARFVDSTFVGNGVQQFDTESPGGTVDEVRISGCRFDGVNASGDFVLTVSGAGPGSNSTDWIVEDCDVVGGVMVVWATDVRFRRNRVRNPTPLPIRVYRTCRRVFIDSNDIVATQSARPGLGAIHVVGTDGGVPQEVSIVRNRISVTDAHGNAVRCEGVGDVVISDNELLGSGMPSGMGCAIALRATVQGIPFESAVVHRNAMRDWGGGGIQVWGSGQAVLSSIVVRSNVFMGMPDALDLDADGLGAAHHIVQADNVFANGVVPIRSIPRGTHGVVPPGDEWIR